MSPCASLFFFLDAIGALGLLSACAEHLATSDNVAWIYLIANAELSTPRVESTHTFPFPPSMCFGFLNSGNTPFSIKTSNSLAYVVPPILIKDSYSYNTNNADIKVILTVSGNTLTTTIDISSTKGVMSLSGIMIGIP